MNRPERYFRARLAVLITGGALIAALFPMAGTVLAAAPSPPSAPVLAAGSDSGTLGDNITNDTTPTFTGTAVVSNTVDLFTGLTTLRGSADATTGTWSITSSALTEGTYSFTAKATNVDGTSGPSASLSVTILTALGVTINQASGQADPTGTSPINFTVVFTHAVTDFATGDVTLGGTAGATTAVVTGSGTTYNVAVSGMTTSGTVTASIAAGKASDLAGNENTASTSTDNTVTLGNKFLVTSSNYAPVPGAAVTITAQLANSAGTAVSTSGLVVTWSSTNGGSFSAATSTTNASGIATVTFTVSTTNGTVHTVTATSGAFTGTSANITTSAFPAVISLTRSHGMITYGESVTFSVQFGTGGATRPFVLEYTSVGVPWTTIANLTTNTSGSASFAYTPTRTGYVRARFDGTTDLGAATSSVYIVGVRQTVALNPHHAATKTIARGTSIAFRTTVRPLRMDLAASMVTFRFYQKVSGAWVLKNERHVATDTSGVARTTFRFGSGGGWYVRAYAPRTPYNSISRFTLREYYLVP
jgi:hypothetical protein